MKISSNIKQNVVYWMHVVETCLLTSVYVQSLVLLGLIQRYYSVHIKIFAAFTSGKSA